MTIKQNKDAEENIEEASDYFEWNLIPVNAASDNKTGVTFKGRDAEYIKAHKAIQEMMKVRGERYIINGIEVAVVDAPKNKPSVVDVKPKNGMTGKANIKIYDMNKNGGATMYINQRSGSDIVHVKTLAFKVVKFLLEKMISGDIEEKDLEKFRKPSGIKNKNCTKSEKESDNQNKSQNHLDKKHSGDETYNCDFCDYICKSGSDMKIHTLGEHAEIASPSSKRMKKNCDNQGEVIKLNVSTESMEVDDEVLFQRTKLQDKKVLTKRKKEEEKDSKFQEEKRKQEIAELEDEKKRKRQKSMEKKKTKKKYKKESENKSTISVNGNKIKEIDTKYEAVFDEAGIDIKNHVVFSVKPDGACGSNCVALHCHRDQSLGQYVRNNANVHLVNFWPFFKNFYSFPMSQKVGSKNRNFKTEEEFITFLKSDKKASLLWMDHPDLQAVCNMYKMNIHILTTDIAGIPEPRARWTHLTPDSRLVGFSNIKQELPDMWLVHVDEIHFDLIIKKESDLVNEGSLDDIRVVQQVENKHKCIICENYFESDKLLEEHKEKHRGKDKLCSKCDKEFESNIDLMKHEEDHTEQDKYQEDQTFGPGYMGWTINETKKISETDEKFDKIQKDYSELKIEFKVLKEAYEKLAKMVENQDKEKKAEEKNKKGIENEIKQLKEEYKNCIDAIRNETYARNKAEELVKVLKDTIKAQKEEVEAKDKRKDKDQIEDMETDMEVEEVTKEWIKPRNPKRKHNNSYKKGQNLHKYFCRKCEINFVSEDKLKEHAKTHKSTENKSISKKCEQSQKDEVFLQGHPLRHIEDDCENCEMCFKSKVALAEQVQTHREPEKKTGCNSSDGKHVSQEDIEEHVQAHRSENTFNCDKCNRKYTDMNSLRRHDWRNHREVECNICNEMLSNRQAIGEHRRDKHEIFTTKICKFFPECYDGDECFFEHKKEEHVKNVCPNGPTCTDQSCKFSVWSHRNTREILCKFQERCHRANCIFKHTEKKGFLGEGARKGQIK